jgi:hypothetical protein
MDDLDELCWIHFFLKTAMTSDLFFEKYSIENSGIEEFKQFIFVKNSKKEFNVQVWK